MGNNCAPFAAELFLLYNERYFLSLSDNNQAYVIELVNST